MQSATGRIYQLTLIAIKKVNNNRASRVTGRFTMLNFTRKLPSDCQLLRQCMRSCVSGCQLSSHLQEKVSRCLPAFSGYSQDFSD